jgi:hypothetical protein
MQRGSGELGWPDLREQEPVQGKPGLGAHMRKQEAHFRQEVLRNSIRRGDVGPGTANVRLAQYHEEKRRAQQSFTALQRRTMGEQQSTSKPLREAREYSRELTLRLTPNGAETFMRQIPKVNDASRGTPGLTSLKFEEYRPGKADRWLKATALYSSEAARDMSHNHNYHVLLDTFLKQLGPELLASYEHDLNAR